MPKSPLLGVEEEKKKPVVNADEASDELDESEDEEDESDEDSELEDEDEEEDVKPKKRAPRKPNSMANTGTLGDCRIDQSIPLSTNARLYHAALLKSPLVATIVPPDMLNEANEHVLCVNSLRVIVPKGRIFQAPMLLAEVIAQSFKNRV